MRVIYIVDSTLPSGATLSFMNMVRGIKMKGITPIIVTPIKVGSSFADFLEEENIRNYKLPLCDIVYPRIATWKSVVKYPYNIIVLLKKHWQSYVGLSRIVKREQPSIIHTNVGPVYCGHLVAKKLNIPHIWHIREYQDADFGWRIFPSKIMFKKMLQKDNVITITNNLIKYFDLEGNKNAICIYNGILNKSNIRNIWPKEKYFITANNLNPAKSMEDTIKGFAEFCRMHTDYKLVICGEGEVSYVDSLKRLALGEGCSENIEWRGYAKNVGELMSKAMALIVSSRSEGFGRMTAEACFMGCMPIGRNTAGTKEIIDKTGGVLFDTPEELPLRMEEVVSMSEKQYNDIILNAQRIATETYSIESNVEKVFDFYHSILTH